MELVPPSTAYRDSYLEALAELHAEGRRLDLAPDRLAQDFPGFVRSLLDRADPAKTPPARVPDTVLWLVDGDEYIGRVSIRHTLDDYLLLMRGHIGYEIRPSRRRKGYGTRLLGLALPEARKLGLARVLLTCDPANTASRKIIERNGGRLENEIEAEGETVRRYWIEIPEPGDSSQRLPQHSSYRIRLYSRVSDAGAKLSENASPLPVARRCTASEATVITRTPYHTDQSAIVRCSISKARVAVPTPRAAACSRAGLFRPALVDHRHRMPTVILRTARNPCLSPRTLAPQHGMHK